MIQASRSSAPYGTQGAVPPVASLQAQLVRLQKELSECVNCASAKSLAGKEKITTIADKIGMVKTRLNEIAIQVTRSDEGKEPAKATEAQQLSRNQASSENRPIAGGTVGSIINISA